MTRDATSASFACRRCKRSFGRERDLDRHVRKAHAGRPGASATWTWVAAAAGLLLLGGAAALAIVGSGNEEAASESRFELAGEPRLGAADAPVAIVAFEDPSCPYCRIFHHSDTGTSTFDRILGSYVADGTVRFYFKEFLAAKPWGRTGAVAQECAFDQGNDAFWNVTAKLYRDAPSTTSENVRERSMRYAAEEGLDLEEFGSCVDSERTLDRVHREMRTGQALGVSGTPAYFVMGPGRDPELIVGPQPFETFAAAIERARGDGGA